MIGQSYFIEVITVDLDIGVTPLVDSCSDNTSGECGTYTKHKVERYLLDPALISSVRQAANAKSINTSLYTPYLRTGDRVALTEVNYDDAAANKDSFVLISDELMVDAAEVPGVCSLTQAVVKRIGLQLRQSEILLPRYLWR